MNAICLITGATHGIGYETALGVARAGATTIIAGRDPVRTAQAAARISAETGNPRVEHLVADLSSQRETKALAQEVGDRFPRLNVLVNNAGLITSRRLLTSEGIEMQWAVNHLAYHIIAESLAELLVANAPARIVNVASDAHYDGRLHLDDLSLARNYWGPRAYNQSKLANVLHAFDLARRLQGTGVTANCLHPGVIRTNLGLNNRDWLGAAISIRNLFIRSPREGARTSIYLATAPDVAAISGTYFAECTPKEPSASAKDRRLQERLRQISHEMTGVPAASTASR